MQLKEEIKKLKEKKKALILAHNYQRPEIQELADFVGDSLELARQAAAARDYRLIVLCGVRFMAETAKILCPEKKVILPVADAGCPLADMAEVEAVQSLKENYPQAWVVSYVNTSARVKAVSDVCCTSSNAAGVIKNIPAQEVIFLPDRNLCWYVKQKVTGKKIICWDGFCIVHERFTVADVQQARKNLPEAEIIVHPECKPEVQQLADGVYSTSGMLQRCRVSPARQFVIGTEEGLIYRLQKENPEKEFFSLGPARICVNMKKTDLPGLFQALEKEEHQITLPEKLVQAARKAVEMMVQYN